MKLTEEQVKKIADELILGCKKLNVELSKNDIDAAREMIIKRLSKKNITGMFDFYEIIQIKQIQLTFEITGYNKKWSGSVGYYINSKEGWKAISPPAVLKNIVSSEAEKEKGYKDAAIANIKKKLNKTELAQLKKYLGYSR